MNNMLTARLYVNTMQYHALLVVCVHEYEWMHSWKEKSCVTFQDWRDAKSSSHKIFVQMWNACYYSVIKMNDIWIGFANFASI